jgi:hypothetical protein
VQEWDKLPADERRFYADEGGVRRLSSYFNSFQITSAFKRTRDGL